MRVVKWIQRQTQGAAARRLGAGQAGVGGPHGAEWRLYEAVARRAPGP